MGAQELSALTVQKVQHVSVATGGPCDLSQVMMLQIAMLAFQMCRSGEASVIPAHFSL